MALSSQVKPSVPLAFFEQTLNQNCALAATSECQKVRGRERETVLLSEFTGQTQWLLGWPLMLWFDV